MGTISTGVGLISGLNIQDIVTQLMALEARPLELIKARIETTQKQQTAFTELNARLMAARSAVYRLSQSSAFEVKTAASSNEDVLTATAGNKTPLDTYTFQVKSLVATHQLVTSGFADRDTAPIGAGVLTLEIGKGNVAPATELADLNGYSGVRRGVIQIVDRSGAAASIDLRAASTVEDVLDAINSQSFARVRASTRGDSIVITDVTGLTTGAITVSDLSGYAAADLGIAGSSATGELVGSDILYLTNTTRLGRLNDGNGVRTAGVLDDLRFTLSDGTQIDVNLSGMLRLATRLEELNDGRGVQLGTIRITNRSGATADIDLSAAATLEDVVIAINGSGISVTAALAGSKITLSDTSGGTGHFKIEDVTGRAAADLGIAADVENVSVVGTSIYRVDTVGAVLRAIQHAANNGGKLVAAISPDGGGLVLQDTTGGTATMTALNGSRAIEDLGLSAGFSGGTLQSRALVGGLNTVLLSSLNGGSGVDTSELSLTRSVGGVSAIENIDLSGSRTLQDVIDAINSHTGAGGARLFNAQVSAGGTGITITDIAGGELVGAGGVTATALHLTAANGRIAGGDLQFRYISEATRLSELNGGAGVGYGGTIRITARDGASATLKLSESFHATIGDVIKAINALGIGVTAEVNANGDGISLTDTTGGDGTLTVAEEGAGTAAADLGILGTATDAILEGSFARSIVIDSDDSLDDVVNKINQARVGVRASVINDGTSSTPYRLILSSLSSGTRGQVQYSSTSAGLNFYTLSEAKDARVIIGDPNAPDALVISSSSNTIDNVVEGLKLQLKTTSDTPVQVSVEHDVDQVVSDVQTMVKAFNDTLDRISDLTSYVPESKERGVLLGDATVQRIRDRLLSRIMSSVPTSGLSLTRFSQVGLTIGQGAHLMFDEEKFRKAFEADPEGVSKLFTLTETDAKGKTTRLGLAARLDEELTAMTTTGTGMIARQINSLQSRVEMFNDRSDRMQKLLDQKEARIYAQFQAMEKALAALQGQQASLAALANVVNSMSSSSGVLPGL